jgi:transcription elongation GreA/GreB family factor
VEDEKRLRKKLFQHLDEVLSVSQKKFTIENKPDKERRAWARILIQAINSYGKLLECETLEIRIEELEEKLKNGVLIPVEKHK